MDKDYQEAILHLIDAAEKIRLARAALIKSKIPTYVPFTDALERFAANVDRAKEALTVDVGNLEKG